MSDASPSSPRRDTIPRPASAAAPPEPVTPAALRSVWDRASDLLEDVGSGRACFAQMADVLAAIAEDAAAGLADVATAQTAD